MTVDCNMVITSVIWSLLLNRRDSKVIIVKLTTASFVSGELKKLVRCFSQTLALILKSLTRHSRNIQLNTVGLMAIENILRTGMLVVVKN